METSKTYLVWHPICKQILPLYLMENGNYYLQTIYKVHGFITEVKVEPVSEKRALQLIQNTRTPPNFTEIQKKEEK